MRKNPLLSLRGPQGTMDRVRRLGLSRDMPALLDAADGFVLASAWEGMPLVVGEAWPWRKPVVADRRWRAWANLSAIPPHWFQHEDADAPAEAMLKVMQQTPDTRRAHGCEARARIITHFNTAIRFPEWESTLSFALPMRFVARPRNLA